METLLLIDITGDYWRQWYKLRNGNKPHRTQDEIFMYTAITHRAKLITLDNEMIKSPSCFVGLCETYGPYDFLQFLEI